MSFAHSASALDSERELLLQCKELFEDRLQTLQVRLTHQLFYAHDHQSSRPVPPQAEEADLRRSLDECAEQAPDEEALLMIGHVPPGRPQGQAVELQRVRLLLEKSRGQPVGRTARCFSTESAPAFRRTHGAFE